MACVHVCGWLLGVQYTVPCPQCLPALQDQVASAPYFTDVFRRFTKWLEEKQLGTTHRFSIVTDW